MPTLPARLRHAAVIALAALTLALTPATANAQTLELPGGKYDSPAAYLVGTWNWARDQPRENMRIAFRADGTFLYENFITGLRHQGRYTATTSRFALSIMRSCQGDGAGARCEDRAPPIPVAYPFTPVDAGTFHSNHERWQRAR